MLQLGILLVCAALVGLDQLTKVLAVAYFKGADPLSVINGVVSFTYTENRGAAWSMLEGQRWLLIGVTSVMLLCVLTILLSGRFRHHRLATVGGILVVAGGIGNLIDRVFRGYVVDFIQTDFMDFPIFNVADCFVVIGGVLLFVYFVFFYTDSTVPSQSTQKEAGLPNDGNDQDHTGNGGDTP